MTPPHPDSWSPSSPGPAPYGDQEPAAAGSGSAPDVPDPAATIGMASLIAAQDAGFALALDHGYQLIFERISTEYLDMIVVDKPHTIANPTDVFAARAMRYAHAQIHQWHEGSPTQPAPHRALRGELAQVVHTVVTDWPVDTS